MARLENMKLEAKKMNRADKAEILAWLISYVYGKLITPDMAAFLAKWYGITKLDGKKEALKK